MPIYEFICRDCQSNFDRLIPASQRDKTDCPTCGSEKTARKISLTAPAQVKTGGASRAFEGQGCGAVNCCGGGCGMPE